MSTLQAIRDLNKVTLYFINKSTNSEIRDNKVILYTNQGWNFNFEISTDTAFGQMNLVKNPLVSALLTKYTGNSMVVDFERKYVLSGTMPLKFSLKCYRILETSVEEDIYKPINTLLSWILPERKDDSVGDILNKAATAVFGTGSWISSIIDSVEEFTGKAYYIEAPQLFREDNNQLVLKIGGQIVKGLVITSINISTPKFVYSSEDGKPIPEYVEITLNLETLRGAVKQDYKFE